MKNEYSIIDTMGKEAQQALKDRPSFSIRARLGLGFLLWFLLSLGITIASILTISRIDDKLYFMEAADNYTFEIQQARRFEKNYFLYRGDLDDALKHVDNAKKILDKDSTHIEGETGNKNFQTMVVHLDIYESLLSTLKALDRKKKDALPQEFDKIEEDLRKHGAEMITVAKQLMRKERKHLNALLVRSKRIPVLFLIALLALIGYLAVFIGRQMLAPLGRIMEATRRIAEGNLTPIVARRKYNDEFGELAIAINHMMQQLINRHNLLVQSHKLKAVGTLTAGIAHELNNPINNIMLSAASLQEDFQELSEEDRLDIVSDLMSQAERARKIVRNLLDFARESELESESIKVQAIVEETLQLASNQIKLAKVRVKGELDNNLPPVYGDRQQLIQVFLNMVLNALDAMPKGGTLTISIKNVSDRDFVNVAFTDTGTGMSEHILSSIFDPFFTTKPGAKGTGLGLPVSLGIIKQHGGDIQVTSQENKGTTFTVSLPVAKVPAQIDQSDLDEAEDDDELIY